MITRLHLYFLILLLPLGNSYAQDHQHDKHAKTDTIAPYIRNPYLPTFSIRLADSSWFSKSQLKEKMPVLLIYFSPECGHCITETEEMLAKMKLLQHLQVLMVTRKPLDEMKNFSDHFQLHKFNNIIVGHDNRGTFSKYYQIRFTPFSALYNKKGKMVKAYPEGIDWNEVTGGKY